MQLEDDGYEYRGVRVVENSQGLCDVETTKVAAQRRLERRHGTGWEFFMVDTGPQQTSDGRRLSGFVILFRRRLELSPR